MLWNRITNYGLIRYLYSLVLKLLRVGFDFSSFGKEFQSLWPWLTIVIILTLGSVNDLIV